MYKFICDFTQIIIFSLNLVIIVIKLEVVNTNEYKEFSQLELIQSWFEAGLKFEIKNCNTDIISYNFPYIFWLGWIITLVSLYLNFRTIEKNK